MMMSDEEWGQRIRAPGEDVAAWRELLPRLQADDHHARYFVLDLAQVVCYKMLSSWPEYTDIIETIAIEAADKCSDRVHTGKIHSEALDSLKAYLISIIVNHCRDRKKQMYNPTGQRLSQVSYEQKLESGHDIAIEEDDLDNVDASIDDERRALRKLIATLRDKEFRNIDWDVFVVCVHRMIEPHFAVDHLPKQKNDQPYKAGAISVRLNRLNVKIVRCRCILEEALQSFETDDERLLRLCWYERDWDALVVEFDTSLTPSELRQHWLDLVAELTERMYHAD